MHYMMQVLARCFAMGKGLAKAKSADAKAGRYNCEEKARTLTALSFRQ